MFIITEVLGLISLITYTLIWCVSEILTAFPLLVYVLRVLSWRSFSYHYLKNQSYSSKCSSVFRLNRDIWMRPTFICRWTVTMVYLSTIVCSSSIYGFWLPLLYLQTLLMKRIVPLQNTIKCTSKTTPVLCVTSFIMTFVFISLFKKPELFLKMLKCFQTQ
jgi:hypothetical protein